MFFSACNASTTPERLFGGKIDLGHVAGNHAFGMRPDAREQHEHLLGRGVLRFVQNHKRVVQRSSTHVSQRRDLDRLARDRALDLFRLEHVAKRIVKRPQIRRDFLFELARKKTERFAGFDGRASQNDSTDLIFF